LPNYRKPPFDYPFKRLFECLVGEDECNKRKVIGQPRLERMVNLRGDEVMHYGRWCCKQERGSDLN
jgi:hypothetical protein